MAKHSTPYDSSILLDINLPEEMIENRLELPLKVSLGFEKLIDHIKEVSKEGSGSIKEFAKLVLKQIEKAPELRGRITDISVLENYRGLIDEMMTFVFPNAFREKQTYAVTTALLGNIFYCSKRFREIMRIENGEIAGELNIDKRAFNFGKIVNVYAILLGAFYDKVTPFDFPIVYKIKDPENGLDKYYKMNFANEFMEIVLLKDLKQLTEQEIKDIKRNIYDIHYVNQYIPLENFEFNGFLVINAIDITDSEILSAIKKDLIESTNITSISGFLKLQYRIQSLLRCPGLLIGLTDNPGNSLMNFQNCHKLFYSFLLNDNCLGKCNSLEGSLYEKVLNTKKVVIVEDLEEYPDKTVIENEIVKLGIRNLLIAPLIINDEIIGLLELGAPEVGMINKFNTLKLREVLPIFSLAVARSQEEFNNKVEAVIKEKCTAIHPSLEWRFRIAAMNLLKKEDEPNAAMEEIVFHNVYPLYGLSDIRNSSVYRNEAIRADLIENIELARNVIVSAKRQKPLHIFDNILYKLDKRISSLQFGISSGDENQILSMLRNKMDSLFDYLDNYGGEVSKAIREYRNQIDSNLGFVYKKRKSYEESASKINEMIGNYLDSEQEKIQKVYPHYFERFKTDGVDHNIYIGASLVEEGAFDLIYLRNIRLWQLVMMCDIARKTKEIKSELAMELETAHLILVQTNPLSMRFRFDEKKFDVDGAYNIRYEIMKKRIDKARIKGSNERLTQPEKIAIVYSHNSEILEYRDFIDYLQFRNYLKKEVEELEIEELQGVQGLKALRVGVKTDDFNSSTQITSENILSAVRDLSTN